MSLWKLLQQLPTVHVAMSCMLSEDIVESIMSSVVILREAIFLYSVGFPVPCATSLSFAIKLKGKLSSALYLCLASSISIDSDVRIMCLEEGQSTLQRGVDDLWCFFSLASLVLVKKRTQKDGRTVEAGILRFWMDSTDGPSSLAYTLQQSMLLNSLSSCFLCVAWNMLKSFGCCQLLPCEPANIAKTCRHENVCVVVSSR